MTTHILILGASYGSLLGTKLLMAGHSVTLACTRPTAELIRREGTRVRFPLRGRAEPVTIASRDLPGRLDAAAPADINPESFDLVVLGMQEAQYGAPGVRELMRRIARSRKPCLAIMNMPPLPYLRRIPGLDTRALEGCYADPAVWADFEPGLVTLASPDPQAFRPAEEPKNVLQVGLPTNFKAARFEAGEHTALLRRLEADIERARYAVEGADIEVPVKLKVHDSIFVPLAKWPMLIAGNYRCIQRDGMIPIREAVCGDVARSREIYDWVAALCGRLGAGADDLVPFEKYAQAASSLGRPSSAARALFGGALHIERVDSLVRGIARQLDAASVPLQEIVALVDERLRSNRMEREAVAA
ncbi:MAG: ketopantoate reductase family protein [Betaproteobacteria bacterium]